MFEQLQKVQNLMRKFDRLLLKGLGLMIIFIFIVGVNNYSDNGSNNSTGTGSTIKHNSQTISYKNCISSATSAYTPPEDSALRTNTSKGYIDLVNDTDFAEVQKDGIPVLDIPKAVDLETAKTCINLQEEVFIIIYNNIVRFYPKDILTHHLVINDQFDDSSIVVVYSPFSNSVSAFLTDEQFGVSGRIYKGNTLFYDKNTESLWLQLTGKAIIGDRVDEKLTKVIVQSSNFERASAAFKNAEVVSFDTGFQIEYDEDPYLVFSKTSLPFGEIDTQEYEKEPKVEGISFEINNEAFFYSFEEIPTVLINNPNFRIYKNEQLDTYEVGGINNRSMYNLPFSYTYYYSHHEIYSNPDLY